jgi:hypothetical protein
MTYLELVQRMMSECGVSGTITTVAGQQGSIQRCVNWVQQAWTEIQTAHDDWTFMRSSKLLGEGVSFPTVSSQLFYPLGIAAGEIGLAADDFGHWDMDSFRCMTTSVGIQNETFMDHVLYDAWRDAYMYGAMQTVITRPVAIAEGPQSQLCLGPASDGTYTITGDFYWAPQILEDDGDVPQNRGGTFTLPERFNMLIVYRAMDFYAAYESAPEVKQRANEGQGRMMPKLEALYLPQFLSGGALA